MLTQLLLLSKRDSHGRARFVSVVLVVCGWCLQHILKEKEQKRPSVCCIFICFHYIITVKCSSRWLQEAFCLGARKDPLHLELKDMEKSWELQCRVASLGPVGIICHGVPTCPSCQHLDVLLHSSLPSVAVPMFSPRPRLIAGRF